MDTVERRYGIENTGLIDFKENMAFLSKIKENSKGLLTVDHLYVSEII